MLERLARKSPAERYAIVWGHEEPGKSEAEPEEGSLGSAYGWAKENWEDAFNIAVGSLFGSLFGTASVERAIRSLEKQVAAHEQRLQDYIRNPEAHDNLGLLKKARTLEERQRIIHQRIRSLEWQIENFKGQIRRLKGGKP